MERYTEYKDSGVKWIGEIPVHWELAPLGRHFTFGKGLPITKADLQPRGVAVISYGQIHSKANTGTKLDEDLVRYVSPNFLKSHPQCILHQGDFIFADTSEDLNGSGNCSFNDYDDLIFAGYHTIIARPHNITLPKYYAYFFQSKNWRNQIQSLVNGIKVFSVNKRSLKSTVLLVPPGDTQEKISHYLDAQLAKIQGYITERERELPLLETLKKTEVAQVVTKGLNHDAPMKDSGITWLGKIPAHWELKRLKSVLVDRNEPNDPVKTDFILSLTNDRGVIPYADKGAVGNKAKEDLTKYKLAYPDDIVLNSMNVHIGSVALSSYFGCVSPVYYMLHVRNPQHSVRYFNYLFQTKELQHDLHKYGKGILDIRMRIPMPALNMVILPVPPIEEQQAIIDYIEGRISQIDSYITAINEELEQLRQYKQRLISDAVTGKIKVFNE